MTKLFSLNELLNNISGGDESINRLCSTWILVMISAVLLCFIVSEVSRNYSQVDKLWSLMPLVYSYITFAAYPSTRIFIMSLLVTVWGFRLSYNFYRKGGYNIIPWRGEEDYRWSIMRDNRFLKGRFRFGVFNFLFISFYQHFLIMMFSTPLIIAARYNQGTIGLMDIIAASLMMTFIIIETVADNQQFRFRRLKNEGSTTDDYYKESLKNGFVSDGLWRIVRHPNFTAEQAVWVSFYLFGVAASGLWINWSLAGSVLLILLFMGSTEFTERISSGKYPAYADYKKRVPKVIPRLLRKI